MAKTKASTKKKKPAKKKRSTALSVQLAQDHFTKLKRTPTEAERQQLRARFMGHEWDTIEAMTSYFSLPKDSTYKWTKGFVAFREKQDKLAQQAADAQGIEDKATVLARVQRFQLDFAEKLVIKAVNQLLGKKRVKGKWVEVDFDSQGTALAALRLGTQVQQAILMRPTTEGGTNNFNGPTQALFVGGGAANLGRALREMNSGDIRTIIQQAKDADSSTGTGKSKKGGGEGA